jgi:hypothetical protein
MTAYIFQQIASKGAAQGIDASVRQRDARTWFRQAAQDVRSVNRNRMLNDKKNVVSQLEEKNIGQMFMYFYDPKLKETLPYYDTFPLIFLIGFKENGFMGINLHYLPPVLRAKLMDSLYETINNNKYDETTKLKINYQILASASRFRYFKPCVKHYLADHVRSDYLNIEPTNWDSALMLPTEQFKKATSEKVWRESRAMV